ncbi:ribokinase [Salinadaptatus halalkaliphilus]|uniref:Ribokinase n=1 Tax=Salinadaptatus halalkaliphilus TaxID=2419781 RepID=A0A4S3TMZ7_9EURY|nr:PfkB family carbohydrate kinase [Salinadaptatus halalkaliphilus]THE64583.1 ribokinase [Salinadaptatus halalkaliphilus]
MSDVVSLGSANVDRTRYLDTESIRALESRYDWFPAAGETVRVEESPSLPTLEDDAYRNVVGGKGANQAVAAARGGADSAFLGCVGTDHTEYGVLETLADRGVDVGGVRTADCETGKAYVFVDDTGESWIGIVDGANEAVDPDYARGQYDRILAADVLLLQNEIPVATMDAVLARLADESERPTVICNPAPADGAAPLLERATIDIVVVNQTEFAALEDALQSFDGTIVRTQGGDEVVISGTRSYRLTPPAADPVDTTGAGDVFCGYLAAMLADGAPIERAADVATTAGSIATETEGVQTAIPTREMVFDALENGPASTV